MSYTKSSKKNDADTVRKIYEPMYGRRLSDKEVAEIEANLTSFGDAIVKIALQIKAPALFRSSFVNHPLKPSPIER